MMTFRLENKSIKIIQRDKTERTLKLKGNPDVRKFSLVDIQEDKDIENIYSCRTAAFSPILREIRTSSPCKLSILANLTQKYPLQTY